MAYGVNERGGPGFEELWYAAAYVREPNVTRRRARSTWHNVYAKPGRPHRYGVGHSERPGRHGEYNGWRLAYRIKVTLKPPRAAR